MNTPLMNTSLEDMFFEIENDFFENENRETTLEQLKKLHLAQLRNPEALEEFRTLVLNGCGGIYIPYLFWINLTGFLNRKVPSNQLFEVIKSFAESNFEDPEKSKMKPLLMTYFGSEKEFELDRIRSFIIQKAHPSVQDYLNKILNFVQKNKRSVEVYQQKFRLLASFYPDFELLNMPLARIQEAITA